MKNNEYQEFNINGQVIRFYDQKGRQKHIYEAVDGDDTRQILNVTTVLAAIAKPSLVQWAANEASKDALGIIDELTDEQWQTYYDKARFRHKELSQEALDIGSKVHGLIERVIKGDMDDDLFELAKIGIEVMGCSEEIQNCFAAFTRFNDSVEEYLECEQLCYREPDTGTENEYIGRKDFRAKLKDGRIGWFDIKTSKDIYPENILQLLAYAVADRPIPIFGDNEVIGVVGCGKDGELKLFIEPINKWLKYYNTFIHLLEFKRGYDELVKDFNKAYKENK